MVVLDRSRSFGAGRARPSRTLRELGAKAVLVERERPPAVDVIESKVTVPQVRRDSVSRTALVLVFADIDLLESEEAIAIVAALIENVPAKSMVALAGRKQSRLPVASLRVGAPLLEIGAYELALSRRETEMLLRGCGVELAEDELLDLLQLSEGWAAGIYLTALTARAEGDGAHVEADGRYLADYVEAEYLERLGPDERAC